MVHDDAGSNAIAVPHLEVRKGQRRSACGRTAVGLVPAFDADAVRAGVDQLDGVAEAGVALVVVVQRRDLVDLDVVPVRVERRRGRRSRRRPRSHRAGIGGTRTRRRRLEGADPVGAAAPRGRVGAGRPGRGVDEGRRVGQVEVGLVALAESGRGVVDPHEAARLDGGAGRDRLQVGGVGEAGVVGEQPARDVDGAAAGVGELDPVVRVGADLVDADLVAHRRRRGRRREHGERDEADERGQGGGDGAVMRVHGGFLASRAGPRPASERTPGASQRGENER